MTEELSDLLEKNKTPEKPTSFQKVKNFAKSYVVDTTSQLAVSSPFFALWEKLGLGFSDKFSIESRLYAAGLFYAGAGIVFSKGRDLYYKTISKAASKLYDTLYSTGFGVLFSGGIYAANGANIEDVIAGAVTGGLLGTAVGAPVGYAIDAGRDLTGIKKSERLPEKIRKLPGKAKKCVAAGLLAGSLAVMAGIYQAIPDTFKGLKGYAAEYFQKE